MPSRQAAAHARECPQLDVKKRRVHSSGGRLLDDGLEDAAEAPELRRGQALQSLDVGQGVKDSGLPWRLVNSSGEPSKWGRTAADGIPDLGVAKTLGVLAVVVPGFPRLREWAYAGLTFDLSGALYSHLSVGDPASTWTRSATRAGSAQTDAGRPLHGFLEGKPPLMQVHGRRKILCVRA